MLNGLRHIFMAALQYVPASKRGELVECWNQECDAVYKIKESLVHESAQAGEGEQND